MREKNIKKLKRKKVNNSNFKEGHGTEQKILKRRNANGQEILSKYPTSLVIREMLIKTI